MSKKSREYRLSTRIQPASAHESTGRKNSAISKGKRVTQELFSELAGIVATHAIKEMHELLSKATGGNILPVLEGKEVEYGAEAFCDYRLRSVLFDYVSKARFAPYVRSYFILLALDELGIKDKGLERDALWSGFDD